MRIVDLPGLKTVHDALHGTWNSTLNRRFGRFPSLSRFARWHLAQRLMPVEYLVPFVNDSRLVMARGMLGATPNWYNSLHELEMAFCLHYLRTDDVLVDVGANVGSYTVLAAAAAGCRAVAIEPIASSFATVSQNIRINDIGNRVTALNVGLADKPGKLRFSTEFRAGNRVLRDDEQATSASLDVTTLDAVVASHGGTVIKIDVEGFELQVLKGATQALRNPATAVWIVEVQGLGDRFGLDDQAVLRLLLDAGLKPYTYDPFDRRLTDLMLDGQVAPGTGGNILFLRDPDAVALRCREAPRFRLAGGEI